MAESTKDLVAKRDMQLRMFDSMKENKKTKGNLPNKKDNARQATLNKNSSAEGARKAGKEKFFEMYENDGRTPKNKEKEMKGMKKMNMGGMTAPMMGDPKSKKPMMPPKRKPAPRPSPIVDPMAKAPDPRMKDPRAKRGAMPMMQEGGAVPAYKAGKKVRGYGMARGGKACKMR